MFCIINNLAVTTRIFLNNFKSDLFLKVPLYWNKESSLQSLHGDRIIIFKFAKL